MHPTPIAATTGTLALVAAILLAMPHHGPTDVVIDAAADKRAGVAFPHAKHHELVESCDTCHHTFEGLTAEDATMEAEVRACDTCHLDPDEPETPGMREMSLKKNPFHLLCVDCHKTEERGPAQCNDCHPKE